MSPVLLLITVGLGGGIAIGGIASLRSAAQRFLDARRVALELTFPRGLKDDQVVAVLSVVAGLGTGRTLYGATPSVAFELTSHEGVLTHRVIVPGASKRYVTSQLRAIVPGLGVIEGSSTNVAIDHAAVFGGRLSGSETVRPDIGRSCRVILAAVAGDEPDGRVWQLVVRTGLSRQSSRALSLADALLRGQSDSDRNALGPEVAGAVLRVGAAGGQARREVNGRLQQAVSAVGQQGFRLRRRFVPRWLAIRAIRDATTPVVPPIFGDLATLAALTGWPVDSPVVPGLTLGGSPQLPVPRSVPTSGRLLGRSTASGRVVAQPLDGASEHALVLGPTGSGKSHLVARTALGDIGRGGGQLIIDPKGSTVRLILDRLPKEAIGRTILLDPSDATRPVPMPVRGEAAMELLRHRYRDLGPRSTDILGSSLAVLAAEPGATMLDLFRLWQDAAYRHRLVARYVHDRVTASFFAWFDQLGAAERGAVLAPAMNKLRPVLTRPAVRRVIASPKATFTMDDVLRRNLVVLVSLDEAAIGAEAAGLIGQVVLAELWSAVRRRTARSFFGVVVDEAARFLDQPTDLADVLMRAREYGVGYTLVTQQLGSFPKHLRDSALTNARTKIVFASARDDATRMAREFGLPVEADWIAGLRRFEAMASVSLGGTVSPPFTLRGEPLGDIMRGRADAVRKASRDQFGVAAEEIDAAHNAGETVSEADIPVGRRTTT